MRVLFCEFGVELWYMGLGLGLGLDLDLDLVAGIILRWLD